MTKITLRKIVTSLIGSIMPLAMFAGQDNVAPQAKVSVSDILGIGFEARNLVDGKVMYANEGEWACKGSVTSWGVMHLPWAQLDWDNEIDVDRIVLYDRVSELEHLAGGTLHFSDGSKVSVTAIPNDGSPKEVCFPMQHIRPVDYQYFINKMVEKSVLHFFSSLNEYKISAFFWIMKASEKLCAKSFLRG